MTDAVDRPQDHPPAAPVWWSVLIEENLGRGQGLYWGIGVVRSFADRESALADAALATHRYQPNIRCWNRAVGSTRLARTHGPWW